MSKHRGMALITVLWMVAALAIIATSLLHSVKGEIRLAGHQRQTVVAGAVADAAIRLVLQDLIARKLSVTRTVRVTVPFRGQTVSVQVQPLNGLIDLNNASETLLTTLFQHGAGVPSDAAALLGKGAVEIRSRRNSQGRPEGFDAPEDLMRVPGVDYTLYATISNLVSANLSGGGRVNPQAASRQMLLVLAQGNAVLASQLATQQDSLPQPMDTTQLNPAFIDTSPAPTVEVSAKVLLASGATFVKTWGVNLSASSQTGLPWRVLEIRQHIEPHGE